MWTLIWAVSEEVLKADGSEFATLRFLVDVFSVFFGLRGAGGVFSNEALLSHLPRWDGLAKGLVCNTYLTLLDLALSINQILSIYYGRL